jgi:hypothetical protein
MQRLLGTAIVLKRLLPPLVLVVLALLFFAPLVRHPNQVLYSEHSDLLAHYLPAKRFLVESWQTSGELPRWCPYVLGGLPFLHDPQVAAFYPPHWLLLLLPLDAIGPALSWLIVLHLLVAGWGTYACARDQGLDKLPALIAGFGFLFAGKWLLHLLAAGHYTTIGLAWLPWALWCLERTVRRGSLVWATGAGIFQALLVLGTQPQWAFYAGIFLGLWSLATVCEKPSGIFRWLWLGGWAAGIALALAAVQLLPTWEAATLSTRADGVPASDVLAGGLRALLFLIGPALTTEPANLAWEDRGGFGLLWVIAAALAPVLCKGRVRYQAAVCLALILFAVGGAALVQGLPGFRLFRQPTRMLLIASLPVSLLAGTAVQALLSGAVDRALCRRVFLRVTSAATILVGGFALRQVFQGQSLAFNAYWIVLLVLAPAAYWALGRPSIWPVAAWSVLLGIDLWAMTWPLVRVEEESTVYSQSTSVAYLATHRDEMGRVLDREDADAPSPLGRGAPLAMREKLECVRGYNPLDIRRYKEYLQRLAGDETPLRPFEHPLTFPILGEVPIQDRALMDLLGVRYLLQPSDMPLEQTGWRKVCEDLHPEAYDVVAGGRLALRPYTIYENEQVFPRAFIIPLAAAEANVGPVDFRNTVLLDTLPAVDRANDSEPGYFHASIREYSPNRVCIEVSATKPGWLVLTDLWYPGWTCTVDGESRTVHRGDYIFRAVQIEAGNHEIVFCFEPENLRYGRWISVGATIVVALVLALGRGKILSHRFAATR